MNTKKPASLLLLAWLATTASVSAADPIQVQEQLTAAPLEGQSCGDPIVDTALFLAGRERPALVKASDALFVLRAAVGSTDCAICVCDVNRSRTNTAADALAVLKAAVGQSIRLACFACAPPPVDDAASYPLEKDGSDTIGDTDAVPTDGASFGPGLLGLAMHLDGIDDSALLPAQDFQNAGEAFSLSAWIRADTLGHGRPIAQKRSTTNLGGYTLETTGSPFGPERGLAFVVWVEGEPVTAQTGADALVTGAWQHVVAIVSAGRARVFVDGIVEADVAIPGPVDDSPEPVVIGRNVVAPTFAWDGDIDEVRFFPRPLTDFEVQALHIQGRALETVAAQGPVRFYRAEENASDSISQAPSDRDGQLENGAGFALGHSGLAFALDGVDDVVVTPASIFGSATEVTATAWIRTTDADGAVASLAHGTVQDEFLLMVTEGRIAVYNHPSSGNYVVRSSQSEVDDGEWTFVAGVLDGSGEGTALRIYVNGVEETGTLGTVGSPSDIVDTTPRSVRIGWRSSQHPIEAFEGSIDEVRVFDRALSSAEILALYEAERGPVP